CLDRVGVFAVTVPEITQALAMRAVVINVQIVDGSVAPLLGEAECFAADRGVNRQRANPIIHPFDTEGNDEETMFGCHCHLLLFQGPGFAGPISCPWLRCQGLHCSRCFEPARSPSITSTSRLNWAI